MVASMSHEKCFMSKAGSLTMGDVMRHGDGVRQELKEATTKQGIGLPPTHEPVQLHAVSTNNNL